MPEHIPNPEVLSRSFPTENIDKHFLYVDAVADTKESRVQYAGQSIGTPHPDQATFPGLKLLKQEPFSSETGDQWFRRYWGTDRAASEQEFYNYAKDYAQQSNAHPLFIREYVLHRATYARTGPAAKSTALTSLYGLAVVTGGAEYPANTTLELTFTSVSGSGATGYALSNSDGEIIEAYLTDGGTGYATAPTVTVANPQTGNSATFTALLQPTSAVLVEEKAQPLPDNDPMSTLYIKVIRVYETLPGPPLISSIKSTLGVIPQEFHSSLKHTTRKVASGTSPDALSFTVISSSVTKNDNDTTAIKDTWELDGVAFPTLSEYRYVEDLDTIALITRKIVSPTSIGVGEPAAAVDTANRKTIEYRPLGEFHSLQIISTLANTPAQQVLYGIMDHSLPPILTSAVFQIAFAFANNGFGGGASAFDFDIGLVTQLKHVEGPFSSRVTRTFGLSQSAELTPYTFQPQTETIVVTYWYAAASERQVTAQAKVLQFHVPFSLHDAIDPVTGMGGPSVSDGTMDHTTIHATTPPDLPSGTWIVIGGGTRKGSFGLWVQDKIEIFIPS